MNRHECHFECSLYPGCCECAPGFNLRVRDPGPSTAQLLTPIRYHINLIVTMPGRLQNKSALITGAGSGIGLESSLLFAAEGANVLLVDINLAGAQKGADLIKERFPNVKAIAVKADVGKEADVKNAVDTAVKEFGRLDVMV